MDSSLSCAYYGGTYAKQQGYYRGKVTEQLWLEAVKQVNALNLDSLSTDYAQNSDMSLVQFILYTSSGQKHLLGADGALPQPLFRLYIWVATHDSALALRPTADSIRFATFIQLGRPAPPISTQHSAAPAN